MTELKAIKMSLDMWKWLYETPGCGKESYPLFTKLNISEMCNHCPCCDYYAKNHKKYGYAFTCGPCPLNTKNGCGDGGFSNWIYSYSGPMANRKEAIKAAKKIYNILNKKYRKLKGE